MPLSQQQTADIQKQYDPLRAKAQRQEAANLQQNNDAIARRAATLGGGPSGAMVKQEQLAQDASAKRLSEANEGISAQEQGALNQAREVQAQRDFTTAEREAGQKFATGERLGSQAYGTQERLGSQQFAAGESALARALQKYGIDIQDKQFNQTLGENKRQYDTDTAENKKTNVINSLISAFNSKIPPEAMNKLFADLGIDVSEIPGLTAAGELSPTDKAVQDRLAVTQGGQGLPPGAVGIYQSGPNKGKPQYVHNINGNRVIKPYPPSKT